jgi:hypothetical protein
MDLHYVRNGLERGKVHHPIVVRYKTEFNGSGHGSVVDNCDHGNESSGSVNGWGTNADWLVHGVILTSRNTG